jgi:hypothetical protein
MTEPTLFLIAAGFLFGFVGGAIAIWLTEPSAHERQRRSLERGR